MSFKKNLLFLGHLTLGQWPWFNSMVRRVYLIALPPLLKMAVKARIEFRHSIMSEEFCAFISDVDICLITDQDFKKKISSFLKIKKLLIMLDLPEVYTQKEFEHLEKIKKRRASSALLDLCWHLRKMGWSKMNERAPEHLLDRYKSKRSLERSLKKLQKKRGVVCLNEIKALEGLVPKEEGPSELCYYSPFLETTKEGPIVLELTREQFPYFNSLMPGDRIDPWIASAIDENFLEVKLALATQELYLSRSVLRLKSAMNEKSTAHELWCDLLEKNIADIKKLRDQRDSAGPKEY